MQYASGITSALCAQNTLLSVDLSPLTCSNIFWHQLGIHWTSWPSSVGSTTNHTAYQCYIRVLMIKFETPKFERPLQYLYVICTLDIYFYELSRKVFCATISSGTFVSLGFPQADKRCHNIIKKPVMSRPCMVCHCMNSQLCLSIISHYRLQFFSLESYIWSGIMLLHESHLVTQ